MIRLGFYSMVSIVVWCMSMLVLIMLDVVIQMEPRIAELDGEGMEQGEERRNAEIVPEMELQGVGAINDVLLRKEMRFKISLMQEMI
ncbi:hypothetical protein Tco_1507035 [Tanacetum coccineum]